MPQKFSVPIEDVVNILGLERDPKRPSGGTNFNVRCPFCGNGYKYHLNINTEKDAFRCVICETHGGVLDLYGLVRFGDKWESKYTRRAMKAKILDELHNTTPGYINDPKRRYTEVKIISPADDIICNKVYRRLLALTCLTLSDTHRDKLKARGLMPKDIVRSRYATLPPAADLCKSHPDAKRMTNWYYDQKIDDLRINDKILGRTSSRKNLIAGFLIANDLLKSKVKVNSVPGFFKLGGRWCFRYVPGMIIPTVSIDGNIVGMQIRTDSTKPGASRYITVSSAGLPEGPTENISRIHVARTGNITSKTNVLLTEGPLKANVTLSLLRQKGENDTAIIAIQGVNNKKGLPELLYKLKKNGVTSISLAFDMDKLTNPNVYTATKVLRNMVLDSGLKCKSLYWGFEFALEKRNEISAFCNENHLRTFKTENPFSDIYMMSQTLVKNSANIIPKTDLNEYRDWGKGKGIDDYLLYLRQSNPTRQTM